MRGGAVREVGEKRRESGAAEESLDRNERLAHWESAACPRGVAHTENT